MFRFGFWIFGLMEVIVVVFFFCSIYIFLRLIFLCDVCVNAFVKKKSD